MDRVLAEALTRGADQFGAPMDARILAGLSRYLELLLLWNERINLTAIRDAPGIIEKHFVDSLAVVPHVPADAQTLLDAGTGPGFPGAVIALCRPDLEVTLVESNHKKTAFLQTLKRELPLPKTTVLSTRLENLAAKPFDCAVSRATWDVPEWLDRARPLVRPGGLILAMEGADRHTIPANARRLEYSLGAANRALVFCPVE